MTTECCASQGSLATCSACGCLMHSMPACACLGARHLSWRPAIRRSSLLRTLVAAIRLLLLRLSIAGSRLLRILLWRAISWRLIAGLLPLALRYELSVLNYIIIGLPWHTCRPSISR